MKETGKYLVTGGAGFIGSHLVDALLAAGNRVVCLDNFSTGKRSNLKEALRREQFRLIEGDIRDPGVCREACAGVKVIFHEAALGSVPRSIAAPAETVDVNVGGFVRILEAARDAKVRRVVYASSSSVYGDAPELPKREERIGRSLSPYALSKRTDELFAENFRAVYGLETVGLRYFNVFGPRQDAGSGYAAVIPKFLTALLEHRPPTINGDGSYSRDFTYIDNVVAANLLAAEAAGAPGGVFNIACGGCVTLAELFTVLREAVGRHDPAAAGIEALHGPERPGDVPHSQADVSRAREQLGYRPRVEFREGVERTAAWFFREGKRHGQAEGEGM